MWQPANTPGELDLAKAGITSIVWATGFRSDWSFVDLLIFNGAGYPTHLSWRHADARRFRARAAVALYLGLRPFCPASAATRNTFPTVLSTRYGPAIRKQHGQRSPCRFDDVIILDPLSSENDPMSRPPLPPFTLETAVQKVRGARRWLEFTGDPARVAQAYHRRQRVAEPARIRVKAATPSRRFSPASGRANSTTA